MARDWKGNTVSTFRTIGASNHSKHERHDLDYYATEPAATEWLCRLEQFGYGLRMVCMGERLPRLSRNTVV